MAEPPFPEKRAVRRAFERAAATYDRHSVLQQEVGLRLLAHLDPIRLAPRRVLDLGCGTGSFLAPLREKYPAAQLLAVDLAHGMLTRAAARTPWWRRALGAAGPGLVCGDAERLPFAAHTLQLVFSNLALQWCRPEAVFAEASRVLEPGGLFLFSTFGPDTLKELRAAFRAVDGHQHVNTFVDMHDLGDALVHAGMSEPVMEMEVITMEYATLDAILADLRNIGARNALPGRPRGLTGPARWRALSEQYEKHRRNDALPASFEVVYGHAWKVAAKRIADGRQIVDFRPRSAR